MNLARTPPKTHHIYHEEILCKLELAQISEHFLIDVVSVDGTRRLQWNCWPYELYSTDQEFSEKHTCLVR